MEEGQATAGSQTQSWGQNLKREKERSAVSLPASVWRTRTVL